MWYTRSEVSLAERRAVERGSMEILPPWELGNGAGWQVWMKTHAPDLITKMAYVQWFNKGRKTSLTPCVLDKGQDQQLKNAGSFVTVYLCSGWWCSNCPCSFPVAYWIPSDLGAHLLVSSFCLFTLSMGFLQQEYWGGLPFPPPVDHNWSELFTMTHLSWMALHGIAHNFIELYKPLCHGRAVIHEGEWNITQI